MEIRNRSTGELTTVNQFKASLPNTSFPKQITASLLDLHNYDVIMEGPQAVVTAPYQISVRSGVEQIDGKWFTKYVAGPTFTDTTDENGNVTSASDNEAAYRAGIDTEAAKSIRRQRDNKLSTCDWTQLADCALSDSDKTAWTTYRQSLRDLPASAGFPHTITWPEAPSS